MRRAARHAALALPLLPILAVAPPPAAAVAIAADDAEFVQVTVYRDRAEVVREATGQGEELGRGTADPEAVRAI